MRMRACRSLPGRHRAPIGRYNIEKDVLPYDVARHVLARADVPSPRPSSQADVRVCVCSADDGNPYYFWRSEDAAIGPPNVKPCHICAGTALSRSHICAGTALTGELDLC